MAGTRNAKIRALYLRIVADTSSKVSGDTVEHRPRTVELEFTGEEVAMILMALEIAGEL